MEAAVEDRVRDVSTWCIDRFYKSSRVKQHLKGGVALRIETFINPPDRAHTFEATYARWRLKFTGR